MATIVKKKIGVKGWTLSEATGLIKAISSKLSKFGYTATIGGSVLLAGESKRNLNLFLVPNGTGSPIKSTEVLMWLTSKLGMGKTINHGPTKANHGMGTAPIPVGAAGYDSEFEFEHRVAFTIDNRKLEVYVV